MNILQDTTLSVPADSQPRFNFKSILQPKLPSLRIFKSAASRLVFGISALYLLIFIVALMCTLQIVQVRMLEKIDTSLMQRFESIRVVHNELGPSAVVKLVSATGNEAPMQDTIGYYLATTNGRRIAGNLGSFHAADGLQTVDAVVLGMESDSQYRFYTAQLGPNKLSLGASMQSVTQARELSLNSFAFAFLAVTLFGLIGSAYFSRQMKSRIRSIIEPMDRFASGDLTARVPVCDDRYDDMDCFSLKINDTLSQLESNVESIRQVSSDIAHELKTPLNRLYIHLDSVQNSLYEKDEHLPALDSAIEETRQINETFKALLRIAQLEAGLGRDAFKDVNLNTLLETIVEIFDPVAEEQGSSLELNVEASKPLMIRCDDVLVTQMLANLIENAISHCPAGTVIKVNAGIEGNRPWVQVSDNGQGVPEHLHEKLFQRLFRVESSRTSPGTGLGLSLVKAVSELHNCSLQTFDKQPGLGIEVKFQELEARAW